MSVEIRFHVSEIQAQEISEHAAFRWSGQCGRFRPGGYPAGNCAPSATGPPGSTARGQERQSGGPAVTRICCYCGKYLGREGTAGGQAHHPRLLRRLPGPGAGGTRESVPGSGR